MKDLIDRLEKATEGSRDLDEAIAVIVLTAKAKARGETRKIVGCVYASPYTSSIDAARTLVPEGWAWSVREGGCYATGRMLKPHAELAEPIETDFGPGVGVRAQVDAATPALALCIAAFKVRDALSRPSASMRVEEGK